jgi:acyl-CoA dehydrogenase
MSPHRSSWMDKDLDQVAELARNFFTKVCTPNEERWGRQHHVDRDVWYQAGELGLLCASIPEEYGGGGGNFAHEATIAIEQVRALAPSFGGLLHSAIIAHYINAYATEEQKLNWLPKMASGEMVAAIAMTEPGTGSDLQNVKTRATKDGDDYVINGAKTFISNGFLCDLVLVVAKTANDGGIGDISLIGIETKDLSGFNRGRNLEKIGQHGQDTVELNFAEVRVPRSNLLGDTEGQGFIQLMQQLPQERLILAVSAVATIEKAVQVSVDYAKERNAFGKPIFKYQNTKFVLAECDTVASVSWAYLDQCIEKHLAGELEITDAAKAKWWLTEQQCIVVDRCVQIFGGYGYMAEYPIARMYADSRIQKIYGGTSEIMKELISRSL